MVGRVKEIMLLRYLSLSFSVFFLFLLHLCSFDPGIFGRMKFGFEVNPLVRNQSRPHRITRVATENGFRDFKRVVELRFTEGNRDRSEQGRKGKRNLENARHAATTHIERTCIVEISPLQTKANFIRACRSLLSTTKIRFFRKSTWVTIFFPPISLSLSLSSYEDGNLVLGEKASLPRRDWKSIMESFFLSLEFLRRDYFLDYFILLKYIAIKISYYISKIIRFYRNARKESREEATLKRRFPYSARRARVLCFREEFESTMQSFHDAVKRWVTATNGNESKNLRDERLACAEIAS